ncbi:MAG: type VI secretion system-associated FHA domain protein TagH, partial [Phycisphaerales bacterium]|nr:type VI secretion system-associated FHA domain protein TagH [Phycisphaerales bacterium]
GMVDSVIKPSFRDLLTEDHDSFEPRPSSEKSGKATVATEPPSDLMEPDRAFFEPPSLVSETPPPQPEVPAIAIPTPEPISIPPEPEQVAATEPPATRADLEAPTPPILDFPAPPPETSSTDDAKALIPEDWWSIPAPATAQSASPPLNPLPLLEPLRPASKPSVLPLLEPLRPASESLPLAHSEPNPAMVAQSDRPNSDALIQALLQGARLPHLQLSEAQWLEVMANIGAIFRETVQGLMEILLARGDVKGEFRLHRTTIGPIENNPLKTSPGQPPLSPEQVMALLLIRQKDAYMSPVEAVCESFSDIKAHQLAVMAGIQAALSRLLERFDPSNLETRLEQSVFDNIWPANRKAKYWDLFTTEYQTIAREAEDDFNELFGDEFARAYEERLRDH